MRKRSELSELTENTFRVFVIIALSILVSLSILIAAKIYQDRNLEVENTQISLSFEADNFPTLQLGHYCLWAVDSDNNYKFLKRFNSVNNNLVSLDGSDLNSLEIDPLEGYTGFVVTIELEGDRNENPNDFELTRGIIEDDTAGLLFDFKSIGESNSYILSTPSDGNRTINEQSGIWFVTSDNESPSLDLEPLPGKKFSYQARVLNTKTGDQLNIGYFSDPKTKDDFQAYSLSSSVFNTPGEDFLTNLPGDVEPPINLANGDYELIVSLEPFTNDGDFTGEEIFLEIMRSYIPKQLEPNTSQNLDITFKPISLKISINE